MCVCKYLCVYAQVFVWVCVCHLIEVVLLCVAEVCRLPIQDVSGQGKPAAVIILLCRLPSRAGPVPHHPPSLVMAAPSGHTGLQHCEHLSLLCLHLTPLPSLVLFVVATQVCACAGRC